MLRPSLIERGMIHFRIVIAMAAVLVVFGVVSFLTMPRQEFPEFTVRQGLVVGVMPGASSKEVEEQVTRPVEAYLFGFQEVNKKKTYSLSKDGQSIVFVELNENVSGGAAPAFWAKLRHGLNEFKTQKLPSQVLALVGNNDFGDTSALLLTVVADGRSPRDLEEYVEVLENHLRRIDATSKLRRVGAQDEVIRVSISRDKLARYAIRPATVLAALQSLGSLPTQARLDGSELELPVYVDQVLRSERELGETIILSEPGGNHVRLKDVASLSREYGHNDSTVRYNSKAAMILSVEMQPGNDITQFGKDLDRALFEAQAELPPNVKIDRIADQPKVVTTSVNHFLRDFGLAIGSVILVTMLLLPIRVASVAAITIPVCIFITLGILNLLKIQLETVSLAALIVVLGMVVDNAIVIIDDHVEKLDQGLDPWTAAWKSAGDLVVPVFTATLAIIMAYAPLAVFLTGMAGEFVGGLPITVAVALTTSMLLAMFLVPIMNSRLIRRGIRSHGKEGKKSGLDRLQGWFDTSLDAAFRHPALTVGIALLTVVGTGLLAVRLPQQLFPKAERNQFAVEVYLPSGRSLQQTDEVIGRIEKLLAADRRVVNTTAFIGQGSPRFHTVYAPNMPSRNYGQLVVNTTTDDTAVEVLTEYERKLQGAFPEGWVRWKQLDMQFAKAPIEVRLSGDDIENLKTLAKKIETRARELAGTTWVRNDYEEPILAIEVVPDVDACARLGVSPAMLRTSLALGLQGLPVATIWEGDYPVRVLLKDDPKNLASLEGLRQQYVSSMILGSAVPLEQLATIRPVWHQGVIVRRNGIRTLTVRADIAMGQLASPVQVKLESYIKSLGPQPGVSIAYGGEYEGRAEVMFPMVRALLVSVGCIYLILLCQFKRHRKVLLVMLTMPLSTFGAVLGLHIARYPFGLTAFVGIIGLMGIVVRNGIILVGYAEELRREHGMSAFDAALAAGKRRMRPIYLTSMAAAIGVVPMILNRSTLWGPLGTVTCFGMLFAMVLTLYVLPVAYWLVTRSEVAPTTPGGAEGSTQPRLLPETHQGEPSIPPPSDTGSLAGAVAVLLGLSTVLLPLPASAESLTLARARSLTLERNATLQQASLEIEASKETRSAARTQYYPQVSAVGLAMVAYDPLVNVKTSGGNLPVYDGNPQNLGTSGQYAYFPSSTMSMGDKALVLALTAVQPIYAGGRISHGNQLADLGVEVAREKSKMAEREALVQTDEKYWRIVALEEKVATLEAYQALLGRLETQVTDALRGGLVTQNDLLKVTLKAKEVEINRVRLEQGIGLSHQDLSRHVGLGDRANLVLTDPLREPVDPSSLQSLRAGGANRRMEVRLLARAVEAESLQTALERGKTHPTVSLGGTVMHTRVAGTDSATNGILFGAVSLPLSDIWSGRYGVASAEYRTKIAEKKLAEARNLIGLQTQQAWDELWASWRGVEFSRMAVQQADVNLREVQDKYTSGLVPLSDLLEAQALRQESLNRQIDTRSEYWVKHSIFLHVVGKDTANR